MDLGAERIESLKAGLVGGAVAVIAFLLMMIAEQGMQEQLSIEGIGGAQLSWQIATRAGIGLFTGFLFGVTYRYIVRQDANPQLKAGSVMAFGLIRGLAQVEVEFDPVRFDLAKIANLSVLVAENIFLFAFIALVLSWAIDRGWIRSFSTF